MIIKNKISIFFWRKITFSLPTSNSLYMVQLIVFILNSLDNTLPPQKSMSAYSRDAAVCAHEFL